MGYDNITVHNCYIIILHKCDELIAGPNSTTQQQQSTPLSNQTIDSCRLATKKISQKVSNKHRQETQQETFFFVRLMDVANFAEASCLFLQGEFC